MNGGNWLTTHWQSTTGRPGTRFGPPGIRVGSQRIGADFSWSVYTGKNALKDWATVIDCGDVPMTWLDNTVAIKQLDKAHLVGKPASRSRVSVC